MSRIAPNPYISRFPTIYERAAWYTGASEDSDRYVDFPLLNNPLFHRKIEERDERFVASLALVGDYLYAYRNGSIDISRGIERTLRYRTSNKSVEYDALISALYRSMDLFAGGRFFRILRAFRDLFL